MQSDRTRLMAFLRRVHRRLVALRMLEAAGVGVLTGSLLCLVLTPLLVWRAVSVLFAAAALVPLAMLICMIWTWSRRPTAADAAGEADRQFGLNDLLSTAYLLRARPVSSPFESAVLLMAESRCTTIAPRDLLLRRLGNRTWGGVGIAAALLLAVGAMTANPIETHAADERRAGPRRTDAASQQARARATASNRYTPAQRITPDFTGDEQAAHRGADPGVLDTTGQGGQGPVTDPSITQADPTGSGSGSGRSNDPSRPAANRTEGTAARGPNGSTIAGGVGASRDATGGAGVSAQSAGQGNRQRPAPPWATQGWASAQQGAEAALRDGSVPPQYHDLVRAYFDR